MQRAPKCHIKRGDMVELISGDEAGSGKAGKVLQVLTGQQRAIVEGLNYIKKHMRKTQDNPKGGIVQKEAPIAVSNLRLHQPDAGPAAKNPEGKS